MVQSIFRRSLKSLQHPQVLHWAKLLIDRSYREQCGTLVISGEKLIREVAKNFPLQCLMTLEEAKGLSASQKFLVNEAILRKITALKAPDGYAAEIKIPPPSNLSSYQNLLVLDQIADPGNLGTLLRTAFALHWDGVVLTPGTVDLFNDKAIRAAKGATFRLPYSQVPIEKLITWNLSFYIADIEGDPFSSLSFRAPFALVLSSEAKGPSSWAQKIGKKISIPMRKEAESLNVASAGAILLYAMRQQ